MTITIVLIGYCHRADIELCQRRIESVPVIHTKDVAHETGIEEPSTLFDERVLAYQYSKGKTMTTWLIVPHLDNVSTTLSSQRRRSHKG